MVHLDPRKQNVGHLMRRAIMPDDIGLPWHGADTGWLFFGELPQIATYIGAAIIVAAGLFVIWREAQLAKR